MVKFKKVFY